MRALQRRALAALDPDDPLAGRLRARLAGEDSYVTGDPAAVLTEVAVARRRGDAVALAEALSIAHHCLLGPGHAAERLAIADELIETATRSGRPVDELMGLAWRTIDLFLVGDRRAVRSLRELRDRLSVQRCDALAFVVAAIDVTAAMRDGRLDEAERLAEACFAVGAEAGDADAEGWFGAQLLSIRWLQGRSAELLDLVRELDHAPTVGECNDAFAAATASVAATAGDVDLARHALAGLRARGLASCAAASCSLITLAAVVDAARTLGDAELAAEAALLLAPHADLPVMGSLAVTCLGSVRHVLGAAALTAGDLDAAVAHFDAARLADVRFGHRPAQAVATAELAAALGARGSPGDAERAAALWQEAIADADRFGMTGRAASWRAVAAAASTDADVRCHRDGHLWTVGLGERSVVVTHAVGMDYLAELIANAGVEIPAVELASNHTVTGRGDGPQVVLDDAAKAAYRRRVDELRAEVDDAEACHDLARAERARTELEVLLDELRRAVGLGGRSRRFGDDAERARVSVRKAITRALAAVRSADAALGADLAARVVTGTRCVFTASPTPAASSAVA
ncbi:MAG: hypothetical protein QM733_07070 [Ilumatobacteraceae bacterium]